MKTWQEAACSQFPADGVAASQQTLGRASEVKQGEELNILCQGKFLYIFPFS